MKIQGTIIVTPLEDPAGYSLDWRRQLAQACITTRLPAQYARDQDLRAYLAHLRNRTQYPLGPDDKLRAFDRIDGWHEQGTGKLLEAFLLTPAPCQEIARDLGLEAEEVLKYGSIHWSVRDQDHPVQGVLARLRAGLPREPAEDDRLIRAALLGGLEGLRGQLGAREYSDLNVMVEQELTRRVMAGELRTGDLIRLHGHDLMLKRMEIESRDGREQDQDAIRLLFEVLGRLAPQMKPVERTPGQLQETTTAIRGRIDSQRLATGIGVTRDAGGEKRLDGILKKV